VEEDSAIATLLGGSREQPDMTFYGEPLERWWMRRIEGRSWWVAPLT
jgi:hypothetical protein